MDKNVTQVSIGIDANPAFYSKIEYNANDQIKEYFPDFNQVPKNITFRIICKKKKRNNEINFFNVKKISKRLNEFTQLKLYEDYPRNKYNYQLFQSPINFFNITNTQVPNNSHSNFEKSERNILSYSSLQYKNSNKYKKNFDYKMKDYLKLPRILPYDKLIQNYNGLSLNQKNARRMCPKLYNKRRNLLER